MTPHQEAKMSAVAPTRKAIRTTARRPPGTVITLSALLGVLVIGALQGGIAMIVDPLQPLGMSVSFLEGSPIDTYFWPGMFLLGIAAASLITIPGLLFHWSWGWAARIESAVGHRWPWLAVLAIGGVLLTFEIIELFMVPFHPVMHPLLIAGSLALIGLVLTRSADAYLRLDTGS
jgi:hypothetical protein